MTLEKSYSEALNSTLVNFETAYLKPLNSYRDLPPMPSELVDLLAYERTLTQRANELRSIKIPPLSFDAKSTVQQYYDAIDKNQEEKREAIRSEAEVKRAQAINEHQQEETYAKEYNASLIEPIRAKHQELLSYKDDLSYVFNHYDITPLDMDISDSITIDEFNTLIDESISTCLAYVRRDSDIFKKITKPLDGESNLTFTLCYSALALVIIYFLLPILAIPAFVVLFFSVHNMYKDLEKLRIARLLMSQIDYNRFVPKEEFKTVEDLDTSYIDAELQNKLDDVKDYSQERAEAMQSLSEETAEIAKECEDCRNRVIEEYNSVINAICSKADEAHKEIERRMKDYAPFPTVQNKSVVMSHTYTLGRVEGRLDVTATLPPLNVVFNSANREVAINTMKLYLANALLSVRVKQLTIEIYDPKNMCGDFTEFFTPETKDYIKPNNMTLEQLLKVYRDYSQKNVLVLDKRSIDDFNRHAEENELVPKEYKLLLLISETGKLNEGDSQRLFQEYFKFSASTGVMVWLLDDKQWPNSIWVDGSYTMRGEALKYDESLGKQAVETFSKDLAAFKDTGIDYKTKFGDVFIPREKWWTFDTIHGIKMPFGLEDGKPDRGLNVAPSIGDANVHALLGGATGAGKSAAINQMLISLLTMYPPSELILVYVDFKNVEAAKFTQGFDQQTKKWMDKELEKKYREEGTYYSRLSRIPHLKIISGTTDGEYALSVFEYLMKEMARRQVIINKFGVTKIEEMRMQILSAYNLEHNGDAKKGTWAEMRKNWDWYKPNVYDKYGDLPRLLIVFDEFQVMYNPEFVAQRIIDMINGKITAITKLARAMATHFWFTSQSMKGTMSKDTMGNFSLRCALRCDADVSNELLGNKAASTIKSKFGFMYTNDSAGQDPGANRYWRVPFLDEKVIPDYVDELNNMLDEFNEKHLMAEFYDEKILVPSRVMDDWYVNYPDTFSDPDTFIIGERAAYSTNKAPIAVSLQNDSGENILIAAFDRNDMMNLTMTLVSQLQKKQNCTIIMNCQDIETHTLMNVENIVDSSLYDMSLPGQDIVEFIDGIEAIVDKRIETGGTHNPIYVFCVQWERAHGISIDTNYKLVDRFRDLMRKAPNVGVHFVMSCREKMDMQRSIPASCNHKICGLLPKDSAFFTDNMKVEKLPDAVKDAGLFAFYEFGNILHKFRIYQFEYTKQIKSREIVL